MTTEITIALPSKGALAEPTLNFLKDCGLKVWKPNPRQYTGKISNLPHAKVMFQRVKDVVYKVADGTAQLGVTGYDVVHEYSDENIFVIHPDLNYGHCQLIVAVPEAWLDVENMTDLVNVAADIRQNQKRNIRIATTYTHSARQFLHQSGIHHFTLVKADGAIEAAPTLGYADAVVDLTQTGTTLRENRLKPLDDGVIVSSQACLIGNLNALKEASPEFIETIRIMLEHIDASLNAKNYYQITANIQGESLESIGALLTQNPLTRGLQGPSVAQIFSPQDARSQAWYAITIIIRSEHLLAAVDYLRQIGGKQTTVSPVKYVFEEHSNTYLQLRQQLNL